MAMPAKPSLVPAASSGKKASFNVKGLESHELIFGLCGPIGCGISEVRDVLSARLSEMGYEVVIVKVSDLIKRHISAVGRPPSESSTLGSLRGLARYEALQDFGNEFRSKFGNQVLAWLVANEISIDRKKRHPSQAPEEIKPTRVCYLVDQLKHPDEQQFLRSVYQDNFFLIGVLSSAASREQRLVADGVERANVHRLMERDRKESHGHGQKLEKTLQLADFFIRNSGSNTTQLASLIDRFLGLIHGSNNVFPTSHEQGMYAAYSAALASACLSRQVGAAIFDENGKLVATGCNDVPRAGGGLYRQDDGRDERCVHLKGGVCFNHIEKDKIRDEVKQIISSTLSSHERNQELTQCLGSLDAFAESIASAIRSQSRLNDLIEFSRAVHAEMDALVSLARSGSGRASNGVLYTTTYPCHNCARHIVAAGIRSVYFIEPYEKSLALELHHDSIAHDESSDESLERWFQASSGERRVKFMFFEGVAPRRYLDLFSAAGDRKDPRTGKAIGFAKGIASKKNSLLLESHIQIEARVVKHLHEEGITST